MGGMTDTTIETFRLGWTRGRIVNPETCRPTSIRYGTRVMFRALTHFLPRFAPLSSLLART